MVVEREALGALLKRYRRQAGLTQEELAERAGVSAHSVSDIERGRQQHPHISTLRRLADALALAPESRVAFLSAGQTTPRAGTGSYQAGIQRQDRRQSSPGSVRDVPSRALPPTNLPDEPTSFVGRAREIAAICGLLQGQAVRLMTLTGPGGVGKTRLAIRVASSVHSAFSDGVCFISLASLTDPTLVPSVLARTLGVKEEGGVALGETLRDHLHDAHLLLVLDNFEHLLDAAPTVSELLDSCRRLHVVVTSRIPLHLVREHEYPVPPLTLPTEKRVAFPPSDDLCRFEAVALFAERAQAVRPDFAITNENAASVAQICARLDGLPLAIELAAPRIKLFPPQSLLQRLEGRLQLLTGGARDAPARQKTLRNTIDWSHGLLSEAERALFARLSVFVGGCTCEAVEAVCRRDETVDVLEGLASLVDQSLVRQEGEDEPRFSMLESIREYAWEMLGGRGEVEELRRHHATFFASLVLSAEPDIKGEREATWFERFDRDQENIQAAIAWHRAHRPETALLLGYVLHQYWIMRAEVGERVRWIDDVCAHSALLPPTERLKVMDLAVSLADKVLHPRAEELFEQSMALREELGDITGQRDALERAAQRLLRQGQPAEALRLFEESLRLQRAHDLTNSLRYEEDTLSGAILTAQFVADYDRATVWATEALARAKDRKNSHDIARWQTFVGWLAVLQGHFSQAADMLERTLNVQRALGDKNCMPTSLVSLAILALEQGDPHSAEALLQEGLNHVQELHQTARVAEHLVLLGWAALMARKAEQAQGHFQMGLTLAEQAADFRVRAEAVWGLAALAAAQEEWQHAMRLAGLASAVQEAAGYRAAPIEQVRYEQLLTAIHSQLDKEVARVAWDQGRVMSVREALFDTPREPSVDAY